MFYINHFDKHQPLTLSDQQNVMRAIAHNKHSNTCCIFLMGGDIGAAPSDSSGTHFELNSTHGHWQQFAQDPDLPADR